MNEKYSAVFGTIVFHVLLVIFAILYQFKIIPGSILKKIEIIEFGMPQEANNEKFISPASQPSSPANENMGKKSSLIPKKVELPVALSADDEPLYVPKYEETAFNELDLNEKIGSSSEKANLSGKVFSQSDLPNEQAVVSRNEDYLETLTNRLKGESNKGQPYILEGEIKNRRIISRIIPKYPQGVKKTTKVKIRFDVLQNGKITNMIVVQKADPTLELNSLNALSKWRFNAIEQGVIQKGSITFIYELQ